MADETDDASLAAELDRILNPRASALEHILTMVAELVIAVIISIVDGLALQLIWSWFITPEYGWTPPHIQVFVAITLAYSVIAGAVPEGGEPVKAGVFAEKMGKFAGNVILVGLALLVGWLVRLVIGG